MDRRAKDAFQTDRKKERKREQNSRQTDTTRRGKLPVTFAAQLCYRCMWKQERRSGESGSQGEMC
jgi:hypothetical protein